MHHANVANGLNANRDLNHYPLFQEPTLSRAKTPVLPCRAIAAHALTPVIMGKRSLSITLDAALNQVPDNEKGLLQTLCLGTLRVYPKLALVLKKLLAKPLKSKDSDIQALLAIGLYQLDYMRTPDHAAIDQTVEAAKSLHKAWAGKLINGVLREYQREKNKLEHALNGSMTYQHAHPQWFIEKVRQDWPKEWQAILAANNEQPPLTLRANLKATTREALIATLNAYFIDQKSETTVAPCEHSAAGIQVNGSVDIATLPGFANGEFCVQDEAAQMAATLLDLQDNQHVLDACSAPGGKATHICESAKNITLTCVESDSSRMPRVQENLDRLGHKAKLIIDDASDIDAWWDGQHFDRILLDVPCSATGVIRRHPDIKLLRQPNDIKNLASLQLKIVDRIWQTLKPGGTLVYATCSILKDENERIVKQFLNQNKNAIPQSLNHLTIGKATQCGRQLFPQVNGHDGFYYAVLRKADKS